MREIEVTCICNQLRLGDLGRSLVRGEVIFVSEAEAMRSSDLDQARRARGVQTRTVERFQERRVATPPTPSAGMTAPVAQSPVPTPTVTVDIRAVLRDEMQEFIGQQVTPELKRHLSTVAREVLADLVAQVSAQTPVTVRVVNTSSGADAGTLSEPVFIPSNIVQPGVNTSDVSSQKTETAAEGLNDAAAALKAAKRRKG